ncbi:trimethylguanosine synthase [Contarinia nasturtii]|uniref:trimethylguanosine synthase n=1 Tax=Contarinia nasturtii TaxID=265458 RepID=UPI0012D3D86B|nr:trimethylguanosine synthase [Contarinia nasturtii]
MTDSNWEALAEIYVRQGVPELDDREYTLCMCSRVLVKNQTEAVVIEQEELSEAYDMFNEQYCDNHVTTMNRKEHSQEEEDSDANSCYFSASASHTDNYCTTDEHERDSGADISEYHGVASTSREIFKRSHRDDGSKSSSTSIERDQVNSLSEIRDDKDIHGQWDKFWSENCERLIWTSWIENYSDFISPEYQHLGSDSSMADEKAQPKCDENKKESSSNSTTESSPSIENRGGMAIIVSTYSPDITERKAINETTDDANPSDSNVKEMMDSLVLPRCDSVSSSIPMTINTTDSMTNVTQISLSSYGFCSSRITSSENSQLSESTPSSLSAPFNFDEEEATRIEMTNDEFSSDHQWQMLWQQHYQEQYNKHYTEFIAERKRKICTLNKDTKSIASEPINTDDDELELTELKQLAELGLPTSFGGKYNKGNFKHTIERQPEEPNTDRVKAAFTLMGYSFQNDCSQDTNGHVMYRKRNIRLHNNMLKMKKKRIDLDSSARDEALLNLIADSSSDEADKLVPNISIMKQESPEQNAQKDDESNAAFDSTNTIDEPIDKVTDANDKSNNAEENQNNKCDIDVDETQKDETASVTHIEDNICETVAPKSNSKKMKKKRRQNKMLAGLPAEIANDRTLYKYWCKRFSLFSLFDLGIKLDRESWFSVTPEKVAIYTAMRCQCDVIVDAFCGAGGNTIQFAKTCQRVIAIDIDEKKIEMAKHNANIYGVAERIEFIVGDYFELASTLKADVVFLSPPWGGPQYLKEDVYDIEKSLLPLPASDLMSFTRKITPNIAIYLPRNTNTFQLAKLAGPGNTVEIEQGFLDRKLIAITAFYGSLLKKSAA